jgi:hypothetical protein
MVSRVNRNYLTFFRLQPLIESLQSRTNHGKRRSNQSPLIRILLVRKPLNSAFAGVVRFCLIWGFVVVFWGRVAACRFCLLPKIPPRKIWQMIVRLSCLTRHGAQFALVCGLILGRGHLIIGLSLLSWSGFAPSITRFVWHCPRSLWQAGSLRITPTD